MTQHLIPALDTAADPALDVLLTRHIAAPRATVFRAWTDPQVLTEWWGPHAVTIPVCELDARPEGRFRIIMREPEGLDYPVSGTYQHLVAPERLVMTLDLSAHPISWHEHLNQLRADAPTAAVPDLLLTVTFTECGGHTSLAIRTSFQSSALRDAFLILGMTRNWNESLDSLSALLPHLQLS